MLNRFLKVFLFLGLFLFSKESFASSDSNTIHALKQASKGNWIYVEKIIGTTSDPAVRDVLNWYRYTEGVSDESFQKITNFVYRRSDWPYLDKIKLEAEKNLNDNVPDVFVIEWFEKNKPITASGVDRYLHALKMRGKHKNVSGLLDQWWPEVNLTRDLQKEFFGRYNRYLSDKAHKKRLNTLLHKGDYANANAIANVLGEGYPKLVKAHKSLAQGGSDVNTLIAQVPKKLQLNESFRYERLKWRRKKDLNLGAIEILKSAPRSNAMYNPSAWWRERHIIARRLIEKKNYKEAYQIVSSHKQTEGFSFAQAEWLSGWLALRFVNEPWKAFEHFEKLYKNVKTPISKARGAYWAGRASDALKHPEISAQWYEVALSYPETFYGQLSLEKMNRKHASLTDKRTDVDQGDRNAFYKMDMVRAAQWFQKAGMKRQASVFLLRLARKDKEISSYVLASELAQKMELKHISLKIAQELQREKNVTVVKYLYPHIVEGLQRSGGVEWALANAIIRQESRFDHKAVSSAGARGLMQLMPATAKEVAYKSRIKHQTSWLTSKPSHNITLGARYLEQMLQRFDGNYAMAAAAYNAGPRRVDQWVEIFGDPRKGEIDLIDWIELIPIYETRNYVQRVLEGVHVYREFLKGKQPSFQTPIHVAVN